MKLLSVFGWDVFYVAMAIVILLPFAYFTHRFYRKGSIRQMIDRLRKKNHFPDENETKLRYAFTCGGIQYFEYIDYNNVPPVRGMMSIPFWEEQKTGCTDEYLQKHIQAMKKLYSGDKFDLDKLMKIKVLNEQLEERKKIAIQPEIMLKIASIYFFDRKENLQDYDLAYNARKIAHWRKHKGTDFFLLGPIVRLFPVLKDLSVNLQSYSLLVERVNGIHLGNLHDILQNKSTTM